MQLVEMFDGDVNCINEARTLRVPYFSHKKDPKKPYSVTIKVWNPEKVYKQEELRSSMSELTDESITRVFKERQSGFTTIVGEDKKQSITRLVIEKVDFVKEYKNSITMHCCLPDHPDRHPSAWLNTQYMYYFCSGCKSAYSIDELALKLQWEDVLKVWLNSEKDNNNLTLIDEISSHNNTFEANNELENKLEKEQAKIVQEITDSVVERFKVIGQHISELHQDAIKYITVLLVSGKPDKLIELVSLTMGGGKSLLIEEFVKAIVSVFQDQGMIIVKERREDLIKLVSTINKIVGKDVAYALYGFDENDCLAKENKCVGVSCPLKKECRYFTRIESAVHYPIVAITHQRLFLENIRGTNLCNLSNFIASSGTEVKRSILISDEKPNLIFYKSIAKEQLEIIVSELERSFAFDTTENGIRAYQEFKQAYRIVEHIFKTEMGKLQRENISPTDLEFSFSDTFWEKYMDLIDYDYSSEEVDIPLLLQSLIKYGGHRVKNSESMSLVTSYYVKYQYPEDMKVVVFDGTADIDRSYNTDIFQLHRFESLRTYENLTFYQCNYIKSSKSHLKKNDNIRALCKQVEKIAIDFPESKIYFPVYKDFEDEVREYLSHVIEAGKIKIAHFGATKGSNEYLDCDITVIGGILHKTEDYYIALYKAITGNINPDINCSTLNKRRQFNDVNIEKTKLMDMIVDYSQEIKRTSQRDNSRNVEGQVYVFSDNQHFLNNIVCKFPGCQVEDWFPEELVSNLIHNKQHKQAKNEKILYQFWENATNEIILQKDIVTETGLNEETISRLLNRNSISGLIKRKGYIKRKKIENKRENEYVRIE